MRVVLLMIGYQKEPIATGSFIKRCKVFNEIGQEVKKKCIYKIWVIIVQTDRYTDRAEI